MCRRLRWRSPGTRCEFSSWPAARRARTFTGSTTSLSSGKAPRAAAARQWFADRAEWDVSQHAGVDALAVGEDDRGLRADGGCGDSHRSSLLVPGVTGGTMLAKLF